MKLVEIKDVRPGQVWINDQTGLLHTVDDLGGLSNAAKMETAKIRDEYLKAAKCRLIGKIGITHRIAGDRLVEIPRGAEFRIDDVVHLTSYAAFFETGISVIQDIYELKDCVPETRYALTKGNGSTSCNWCLENLKRAKIKRIGILGVTHEFVNSKAAG